MYNMGIHSLATLLVH